MLRCLIATMLLALLVAAAPAHAARKVPQGYFGTVADGALMENSSRFTGQLDTMVGIGVESMRMVFDWREAQPYRTLADVPEERRPFMRDEHGTPTDWRLFDGFVSEAAARGLSILPVVLYAPPWAARYPGSEPSPPKDFGAYANFVAALAKRYGPSGSFWIEHPELPRVPISWFQVWNEPHFKEYWSDQPWEAEYAKLLRKTHRVVTKAVPEAKLVAAGMANKSWAYLVRLYKAKARGSFDAVALHPFTNSVDGVVEIIKRGRHAMARYGDAKLPLMITELSWTSAKGKAAFTFGNERTEAGQAKALRQGLERMAKERSALRILRVYWYTWMTRETDPKFGFDYAGLVRLESDGSFTHKPSFGAYRTTALELEACARKGSDARTCVQQRR
jgi:hypothetical protein